MGESKKKDTKALIQKCALKILTKEGMGAFKKTRIADETGLSKQVIQYHYPDLVPLLMELYTDAAKPGQKFTVEALAKAKSPADKLGAMIDGAFMWLLKYPTHGQFFLIMYHWSSVEPKLRTIHAQILAGGLDRIRGVLLESFKYKEMEEVESRARTIHNLMLGTFLRMVSLNDIKNCKEYVTQLREGVGVVFGEPIPSALD